MYMIFRLIGIGFCAGHGKEQIGLYGLLTHATRLRGAGREKPKTEDAIIHRAHPSPVQTITVSARGLFFRVSTSGREPRAGCAASVDPGQLRATVERADRATARETTWPSRVHYRHPGWGIVLLVAVFSSDHAVGRQSTQCLWYSSLGAQRQS